MARGGVGEHGLLHLGRDMDAQPRGWPAVWALGLASWEGWRGWGEWVRTLSWAGGGEPGCWSRLVLPCSQHPCS